MDQDGAYDWEFYTAGHPLMSPIWLGFDRYSGIPDSEIPNYMFARYDEGDTIRTLNYGFILFRDDCHKYIGTRHRTEEGDFYGWIEFTFISEGPYTKHLYVSRMAYCTIPDYPLRAGQTSLDWDVVENEAPAFASVHPNPIDGGQLTVLGNDLREAVVFNTLGQQVAKAQGEGGTMHIDLSGLPSGIYLVSVTDNEGRRCVRKVVKQ